MKILSIIPARGGSKEIPKKNLIRVGGKPLLYHTVSASLNSQIDRTIVTTDDNDIAKYAKKIGAEVIIRPKKLANNMIPIEPAMDHVLKQLGKEGYIPDNIVLLQNTSPLRNSIHINEALSMFINKRFDSVFSGFLSHYLLWQLKNNRSFPINYNPLKRPNRQIMKTHVIENGALYITKYSLFQKTKCRISGKIGIYLMPEDLSIQIDSISDIFMAEQIMKKNRGKINIHLLSNKQFKY